MTNNPNPIPILVVLLLLNSSGGVRRMNPPVLSTLELESVLDNAHSMLHTIEKLNGFAHSGLQTALPDMKKMMEIVEKIPL